MDKAIIVDVDGTLVDVSGARHYVVGRTREQGKDFHHFHLAAMFCPPHRWVLDRVEDAAMAGWKVLIVTARKRQWEWQTRAWMEKHGVQFDRLYMRPDADNRKDVDVKRDILALIEQEFEVVVAIDDNPNVIALWKENNIPVIVVPGWDERA